MTQYPKLLSTLCSINQVLSAFGVDGVCIGGAASSYHHNLPIRDLDIVILDPMSGDPAPFELAGHVRDSFGVDVEVFPEYEDDDTGRIAWAFKCKIGDYPIDFLYLRDRPTCAEEAAAMLDFSVNSIWFEVTEGRLYTKALPLIYPSVWYNTPNLQLDANVCQARIDYIKSKFPQYEMKLLNKGEVCAVV